MKVAIPGALRQPLWGLALTLTLCMTTEVLGQTTTHTPPTSSEQQGPFLVPPLLNCQPAPALVLLDQQMTQTRALVQELCRYPSARLRQTFAKTITRFVRLECNLRQTMNQDLVGEYISFRTRYLQPVLEISASPTAKEPSFSFDDLKREHEYIKKDLEVILRDLLAELASENGSFMPLPSERGGSAPEASANLSFKGIVAEALGVTLAEGNIDVAGGIKRLDQQLKRRPLPRDLAKQSKALADAALVNRVLHGLNQTSAPTSSITAIVSSDYHTLHQSMMNSKKLSSREHIVVAKTFIERLKTAEAATRWWTPNPRPEQTSQATYIDVHSQWQLLQAMPISPNSLPVMKTQEPEK